MLGLLEYVGRENHINEVDCNNNVQNDGCSAQVLDGNSDQVHGSRILSDTGNMLMSKGTSKNVHGAGSTSWTRQEL